MPSQGVDLRADGLEAMLDALPGVFPESDGDIELRDGRLGEELVDVRIALTNGITKDEIAEVIYHAAGYAGFPAATAARTAAREALGV
ncbi:MAG: hypothetical protein EOP32_06525 [Rhodococcus sp. (in: high G+C Gram-positive bacteria)]|nr:MAG: hypothetical protein EOP32_06525 [Rhodococcus sp. (in: high G+C Gram-positive bacteria)]